MKIPLNPKEEQLRISIAERMEKAKKAFAEGRIGDDVRNCISEAGKFSNELHTLLKDRGFPPKHHVYMIKNRELQPDDPQFYMHYHPIEDLLKFLDDSDANNDPVDQTIGSEFTFRVYSQRWKHDDQYRLKRTKDGWEVGHKMIGGPCNKGGQPFLFENFRQDSINFPNDFEGWLERLWNQASSQGLTFDQVQAALQRLADWVTITEENAPSGGIWEGY